VVGINESVFAGSVSKYESWRSFRVGVCLRIPRNDRQKLRLPVERFAEAYRYIQEATDALA